MNPRDGYITYIVNPKSGAGTSSKVMVWRFVEYLREKGFRVRMQFTSSLEHARELAMDAAVQYECRLVVAAGGDGTVRETAHGLEGSDKPLMIVPGGTENLLANELGLDEKLKSLIRTFEAGYTRSLDLGRADGLCFACLVGFGFDGRVVRRVSKYRSGHIRHSDYFWPLWRTFWDYGFEPVRVTVDGRQVCDEPALVFVGNISRYAIGLEICHYADYSDGLLDVCIYKCGSRFRLVKHSALTVLKQHAESSGVVYLQGSTVKVSSDSNSVLSEIDGDPGPQLPVEINIIPHAVNVIVPEGVKPAGIRTRLIRMLR